MTLFYGVKDLFICVFYIQYNLCLKKNNNNKNNHFFNKLYKKALNKT